MRIILEVCPRVTREGGADRLPGISLLPPTTSAHVAIIIVYMMIFNLYDRMIIIPPTTSAHVAIIM